MSKFDRAGFLIFVLVFVSRDSELDQNLTGDFQKNFLPSSMKFGTYVEVDEWCTTVCSMVGTKVKVKVTQWKSTVSPPRD